jgi:hypothetical protein
MKAKFKFLVALASALLLAAFASAVDEPHVMLPTIFDTKSGSPLEITSVKQTASDLLSVVDLKNNSGKIVTRFQLGWLVAVPEGCSASPADPIVATAPPDRVTIPPGGTAQTKDYRLETAALVSRAKSDGIVLLNVQVGVVKIEFADGSSWETPVQGNLFMPDELQFEKKKCNGGKLRPEALTSDCGKRPMTDPLADPLSTRSPTEAPPGLGCYFYCGANLAPIYCVNSLTECTLRACPLGSCPYQTCTPVC